MANSNVIGLDEPKTKRNRIEKQSLCQDKFDYGSEIWGKTVGCGEFRNEKELANPASSGLQGQGKFEQSLDTKAHGDWKTSQFVNVRKSDFWAVEPNVGRVVNWMAARVDRIKALGNGQVPLCAATAWRILSE